MLWSKFVYNSILTRAIVSQGTKGERSLLKGFKQIIKYSPLPFSGGKHIC